MHARVLRAQYHRAPVYHGTAIIRYGDRVIWLDPWSTGALAEHDRAACFTTAATC